MLSDLVKAAAFSAHSPAYRLLPSTLSERLWVFLCLHGGGDVALCGVIHKVLQLFGARSTNCAQNRANRVFIRAYSAREIVVLQKWVGKNPPVFVLNFSEHKYALCCCDTSSILPALAQ